MTPDLPTYSDDQLHASTVADLMRLLVSDEDRLPRNVIDECTRRGDEMLEAIEAMLAREYYWGEDQSDGEWWALQHAVMILGLMDSPAAGELLARFMRRMDESDDVLLEEALSGTWPALFRNKPRSVLPSLEALGEDRELNWYIRGDAVNSGLAWIELHAPAELDQALERAARIAFSTQEGHDLRVMLGATLLSFPRAKDRRALEKLAELQSDELRWFGRDDIIRAYAGGVEPPDWEQFADPWAFYEPQAIEERERIRAEEATQPDDVTDDGEPFVRDTPKVGRNDPCPCGSGRKYKKCCMA